MKPILAEDANLEKLVFPYMAFPKIDGVRGTNPFGDLTARSGKPFKNVFNTEFFSRSDFVGFDGEMVVDRITGDGIANETTSALNTIKGTVPTRWCLFDYVIDGVNNEDPFQDRYDTLIQRVTGLFEQSPELNQRLWVIPCQWVNSLEEFEAYEELKVAQGFEGVILRDPQAGYKYGRTTVKENSFLRVKRFLDAEIVVNEVVEGFTNLNEQKRTPHGAAERSTNKENMVPNGMIGSLIGTAIKDVTWKGDTLIAKGDQIEIAAGKLTHNERRDYFKNQEKILGKIAKYQFFPVGFIDKPRFPTFQGLRDPLDMGE